MYQPISTVVDLNWQNNTHQNLQQSLTQMLRISNYLISIQILDMTEHLKSLKLRKLQIFKIIKPVLCVIKTCKLGTNPQKLTFYQYIASQQKFLLFFRFSDHPLSELNP
jgi:hypothetical protein